MWYWYVAERVQGRGSPGEGRGKVCVDVQNIWSVVFQGLKHLVCGGLRWSVVVCSNKDAIDLVCGGF